MWAKISRFIIQFRLILLLTTLGITAFMAYKAKDIDPSYDFMKVVPEEDKDLQYFREFKKTFGEDGNIFVVGMQDAKVFKLNHFVKYQQLCDTLRRLKGVNDIISIPTLKVIKADTTKKELSLVPLFKDKVKSQDELDSLMQVAKDTKFYEGLLLNEGSGATLAAISIDAKVLNSRDRERLTSEILALCEKFEKDNGIRMHYAGLPHVRSIMTTEVKKELYLFMGLSALVTSLILYFFFRSWFAVLFTFLVIAITVIWTMGTIVLLGYKITILTAILPSLIIVIGIPNCIFMYNKYHQEYKRHNNKVKAISRIIQKIGFLTFMTNSNTAVGFLVLYFTDIQVINEFGLVAGLISFATFLISLVMIPVLLFYLPPPSAKQLKHLDLSIIRRVNNLLEFLVVRQRPVIYIISGILIAISVVGIYNITTISYMVDDLPSKSDVKGDLAFFEQHFEGVMPLEIVVDLGRKKAINNPKFIKKLQKFDDYLQSLNNVSPPLSVLNILKGANQAISGGSPDNYSIPNQQWIGANRAYLNSGSTGESNMLKSFVDSNSQKIRFSCKVADIGTNKTAELVDSNIVKKAQEIFGDDAKIQVHMTGTTLLFLKGNQYLIDDLSSSLLMAVLLISGMMFFIFTDWKMILISMVPNIVPMLMTAGIMGIFDIELKPSTALIFGIAFGISIDSTIHSLSKYKQELILNKGNVLISVIKSLEDTGVSIIYTSIVLFCGFVMFSFSKFGGTVALGVLTSLTLFFAIFTNLILLPAILITFGKGPKHIVPIEKVKAKRHYAEDDDEEIDLSKLELKLDQKPDLEKRDNQDHNIL